MREANFKDKRRKTIKELTEFYGLKINAKTKGEFDLYGEYNDKSIEIIHHECGRISELHPRYFLAKLICPICEKEKRYQKRLEKTKEIVKEFKEELKELVGDEYSVTKDYMDPDERKVSLIHNVCQNEYKIKISSFRAGRRCSECMKKKPKTPEKYKEEFEEKAKGNFKLLSEYEKSTEKVQVHCLKCNEKFGINPSYFLRDSRCPECEKTKPEDNKLSDKNENKIK